VQSYTFPLNLTLFSALPLNRSHRGEPGAVPYNQAENRACKNRASFQECKMTIRQILFFGSVMSVFMALFMSLAMAIINVGINEHFIGAWLKGWLTGFLVSLPLSFVIPPALQKLIQTLHI
jgi:hypothetical protein